MGMNERARQSNVLPIDKQNMSQTVYIVDDDANMRKFAERVINAIGVPSKAYSSVENFFANHAEGDSGCILSDILMPDIGGLEFQQQLIAKDIPLPIILMSAFGDVKTVKSALQNGAVDFLEKPIATTELSKSIFAALKIDKCQQQQRQTEQLVKARLDCLTGRERQILDLLMFGENNTHIADVLHISLRTVETHRHRIIKKMHADSFQELLRILLLSSYY